MFAATPDIMCATGQLSRFLNNPSSKHMAAAKRFLRYLKDTLTLGIIYRPSSMRLIGYSDADWAGDVNTRCFIIGYAIMIKNTTVAWKSQCQTMVTLSTMEAEYVSLMEVTKELKWIGTFLAELG